MKPKGVIQMFKVIQNFIRKNSRGKLFFSAALFLLYSASPSPTEARWGDLSLWDEKVQTEQFLLEELNNPTKVESVKDNPDLLRIQREIVNANPGVLWFKGKNVHDYGLRPIQEIKRADQKGSSYNSGDGFIYVTHDDLLYMNGIYPYATRRKNDPWHVYNNSQIAFTIAHEIAHWKNPEKYYRTDKEQVVFENNADRTALELLEAPAYHGYGGALIEWYRSSNVMRKEEIENDKEHAAPQTRFKAAADYVKRASNGRVKIDLKGNCTYDGKPIFLARKSKQVPTPFGDNPVIDVIPEERTMYVAGQIAFAIKYGVWNKKNLIVTTHDDAFGTRGWKFIVLAVNNPKTGGFKVIDKFYIKPDRFYVIYQGFLENDASVLNHLNEEEEYFLQLISYIYENSNVIKT